MAIRRNRPPRRLVYVQLSDARILLRHVATGTAIDDVPQMALDLRGVPVAYGRAADDVAKWRGDARVVNAFRHPRCLIDDMEVAAATLRWFLHALPRPRFRRARWDVVLHPAGVEDLSGLEAWGLQRIAHLAGAASVRLWLGEEPPYDTLIGGLALGGSWRALPPPAKKLKKK